MKKDLCQECFELFNEDFNCYTSTKSVSERRQVFRVNSKHKSVCCIKIDGGIIAKDSYEERCDCLFVIKQNKERWFLFVELKGGSVSADKGVSQLVNTIEYFKTKYLRPSQTDKILGFIIGGEVTESMAKLKKEFIKRYKGELIHKAGNKQTYEFL